MTFKPDSPTVNDLLMTQFGGSTIGSCFVEAHFPKLPRFIPDLKRRTSVKDEVS
jgi:hypothetical protein